MTKKFKTLLNGKTCRITCTGVCLSCKKNSKSKLLTLYLNLVIPDWREMENERLYKHAQKTLENTEEIRRFEIELLWKRSAYMVGLLIALFVAFGQIVITKDITIAGIPKDFLLLIISLINTYISACFALINIESHRWQQNWEIHADYLHEVLGSRLMRVYFRKKATYFTIGKINVAIGIFMGLFWFIWFIMLLLFILNYASEWDKIIFSILCLGVIILSIPLAHGLSCLFKTRDREFKLDSIDFSKEAKKIKKTPAKKTPAKKTPAKKTPAKKLT